MSSKNRPAGAAVSTDLAHYDPAAIIAEAEKDRSISTSFFKWWSPECQQNGKTVMPPVRGVLIGRGTLNVDGDTMRYYTLRTSMPTMIPESQSNPNGIVVPPGVYLNIGERYDLLVLSRLMPKIENGVWKAHLVTIIPRGQINIKGGRTKWEFELKDTEIEGGEIGEWAEEVNTANNRGSDTSFP